MSEKQHISVYVFEEDPVTSHTKLRVGWVTQEWLNAHLILGELQEVPSGQQRERHVAGDSIHAQQVVKGGFSITFGDPNHPESIHLQIGDVAVFQNRHGSGHSSVVDTEDIDGKGNGCIRFHSTLDERVPLMMS